MNCYKCDISIYRHNIVKGSGNLNSPIIFIGEGPGATEDRTGIPFTGKSGKLFNQHLELCGFSRDDVFVTNVIRCYPGRRAPSELEISNCVPYLFAEIAAIKPQIIMLLGATALKAFFNNNSYRITNLVGKIIILPSNIVVVPNFHPSYLLREKDPKLTDRSLEAYKILTNVYRKLINPFHQSNF